MATNAQLLAWRGAVVTKFEPEIAKIRAEFNTLKRSIAYDAEMDIAAMCTFNQKCSANLEAFTAELASCDTKALKRSRPVWVYDFDVLSVKYSYPERPFPEVVDVLNEAMQRNYVCVASFNPRAGLALQSWGVVVDAMCSAANHFWLADDFCWHDLARTSLMIDNMLATLGLPKDHPVVFADDCLINIAEATSATRTGIYVTDGVNLSNCIR